MAPNPPDRWESLRWLATPDERVLWTILGATVILGLWGAWVGWRRARR